MGGKGSGGGRPGAGRKPKSQSEGALTGSRRTRARARSTGSNSKPADTANQNARNQNQPVAESAAPLIPELVPQPPGSLTLEELAEWNDLAPRAARLGTLTDDTLLAMLDLCQSRVLKTKLLRSVGDHLVVAGASGAAAAHPLLSRFTTLLQRVDAGMLRFKLSPMGKELTDPDKDKPEDPFAEFAAGPTPTRTVDGESVN